MDGSLIGGGLKVASSIFGGIQAARAASKQRKSAKQEMANNNNYLAKK